MKRIFLRSTIVPFLLLYLSSGCQRFPALTHAEKAEIESNLEQTAAEFARLQEEVDASGLAPAELGRYYDFIYETQHEYEGRKVREPLEASRWYLEQAKGKPLEEILGGPHTPHK